MYKPIADFGIIGNCRSCALVSDEGSIDFMCLPDFDSGAQFCSILDEEKGGFFKISPVGFYQTNQKYKKNTNILKTYFFNTEGSISLTDFMPISAQEDLNNDIPEFGTKIVRLVKALKGDHDFELKLKITPDFVQETVKIEKHEGKIVIKDSNYQYILYKKHHQVKIKGNLIVIKFKLNEGEQEFFSLDFWKADQVIKTLTKQAINAHLAVLYTRTTNFWQQWAKTCKYQGPYQPEVLRSALTLKLLTYSPTGAIVAAATTSIPEKIGGNLNWDYRFTWLRDASFTVYAFLGLGYLKEASRFMDWLEMVCLKEGSILKIMYGIHGEEELTEATLPHLSGYRDSKPVRVGNGAANQKQFDIFGEVLGAIDLYIQAGGQLSEGMTVFVKKLVDYCCIHWREKDAGIWEMRYGEKHNTYSKIMCWAGVDKGINIAKKLKIYAADLSFWEYTRDLIKRDILKKGYNKKIKSFTAFYNSEVLDTSTLNVVMTGLLPADDQRVLNTIDNIMQKLTVDWFVLRTSDSENKLQEGEGAFYLPTFWLVDCLSFLGRVDEAKIWLDRIVHSATPLGLYAEEFEPYTKEQLGNFPQAFTHLGFINSIINLKQAEVFGSENKPTGQTERLTKVVRSLFGERLANNLNKEVPVSQMFRALFRH